MGMVANPAPVTCRGRQAPAEGRRIGAGLGVAAGGHRYTGAADPSECAVAEEEVAPQGGGTRMSEPNPFVRTAQTRSLIGLLAGVALVVGGCTPLDEGDGVSPGTSADGAA